MFATALWEDEIRFVFVKDKKKLLILLLHSKIRLIFNSKSCTWLGYTVKSKSLFVLVYKCTCNASTTSPSFTFVCLTNTLLYTSRNLNDHS